MDDDLNTVFGMIDVTRQGFVTGSQLRHAAQNLAARPMPKVDAQKKCSLDEFKEALAEGLQTNNSWAS